MLTQTIDARVSRLPGGLGALLAAALLCSGSPATAQGRRAPGRNLMQQHVRGVTRAQRKAAQREQFAVSVSRSTNAVGAFHQLSPELKKARDILSHPQRASRGGKSRQAAHTAVQLLRATDSSTAREMVRLMTSDRQRRRSWAARNNFSHQQREATRDLRTLHRLSRALESAIGQQGARR